MPVYRLQVIESSGSENYPADEAVRVLVRADWLPDPGRTDRAVTAHDILADPLMPRLGDRLIDWKWDGLSDAHWNGGPGVSPPPPPPPGVPAATPERPGRNPSDTLFRLPWVEGLVLVSRSPRQDGADANSWLVELEYAGGGDPLAVAPDVEYSPVPYQTQEVADRFGTLKTNSAYDPYEEGTPRDRTRRRVTIVRNVAYDQWSPDLAERFENTLNLKPYTHGGLVRFVLNPDGSPVLVPGPGGVSVPATEPMTSGPLTAKLLSLQAVRVLRAKSAVYANRRYYWRAAAVLEFDVSRFVDNNGRSQPRRWRTVLADAGLRELKDGRACPVFTASGTVGSPVPLDGRGRANQWQLPANSTAPQLREVPAAVAQRVAPVDGVPTPTHQLFSTHVNQVLEVAAPGLIAGAEWVPDAGLAAVPGGVAPAHGSAIVEESGAFRYEPAAGYRGFDHFTYSLRAGGSGGTLSNEAVVVVFTGEQLKVRVFEDYEPKDWAPIAHLLEGW